MPAVIAFNLTRAVASLTDPQMTKATTATIRRKLITVLSSVLNEPSVLPEIGRA